MMGYVWAAGLLHGEPIAGVIINRLLLHKNKKSPAEQFERRAFNLYPEQIEEWRKGRILDYHDIARHQAADFWPMRTRNCSEKFGLCQFHKICTTNSVIDREKQLEAEFIEEPWDWMTVK